MAREVLKVKVMPIRSVQRDPVDKTDDDRKRTVDVAEKPKNLVDSRKFSSSYIFILRHMCLASPS